MNRYLLAGLGIIVFGMGTVTLLAETEVVFKDNTDGSGFSAEEETANTIPDTSEIISEPTTEINKNAGDLQNSVTSFTLEFPLKYKNWTPYTAYISSVFDHSMIKDKNGSIQRNNGNEVVESYTAEIGDDKANTTDSPGYSNKDGTDFLVNNHYVGATGGKKYLNYDGHPGYDYPVEIGTPVYAAAEGTIHKAEWNVDENGKDMGGGYYIKIKHNDGAYYTSYLHLSEFVKFKVWNEGEHVDKGQQIALSGNTAFTNKSTDAHLHFEVRIDGPSGASIDPYGWHPPVQTDNDPYDGDPYGKLLGKRMKTLWEAATDLPQITSISPSSGVAGTSVTINGDGFGAETGTVKFGTVTATVASGSWSDTQMVATVPAGDGNVYVRVTTGGTKDVIVTSSGDEEKIFTYTSSSDTITHTFTAPSKTTVSRGGSLGPFTVKETNNSSSYYSFYVQPYIIKPDGTTVNFKQVSTGLNAGKSRTHYHYLSIPSGSELGTFTYGVKITDTDGNLIDDDSFEFTVVSGSTYASKRSDRRLKRLMRNPETQVVEEDGWKVVIVPERNR